MTGDFTIKIIVGGDGAVGKTTILYRYVNGQFLSGTQMTIGVQLQTRVIHQNGTTMKLVFWDLGGQDRFRFILPAYCVGACGAFVLFDMNADETFESVKNWATMFKAHVPTSAPMILVGTKMDLVNPEKLPSIISRAQESASRFGFTCFVPTSAKTGENVDAVIDTMFDAIVERMKR